MPTIPIQRNRISWFFYLRHALGSIYMLSMSRPKSYQSFQQGHAPNLVLNSKQKFTKTRTKPVCAKGLYDDAIISVMYIRCLNRTARQKYEVSQIFIVELPQ
jgi:hypothetical protein